jgi:hypothetical protein
MSLTKVSYAMIQGAYLNVLDYAADNTGATDSTTAFNNAIAALPTNGGTIYIPPGVYALNLVINTSGVCLIGPGLSSLLTAPTSNFLRPFDTTKPVIQIGNDTKYVTGVILENILFYGTNTGTTGLYCAGGCYRNSFVNISSFNFVGNCIKLQGGASYACAFNNFVNINVSAAVNGNCLYVNGNVATYTTANYITNFNFSSNTGGHAVVVDSTFINLLNGWVQASNLQGLQLLKNGATESFILANNVSVDSDFNTDILVETYGTSIKLTDFIKGTITVDGKWKDGLGNTLTANGTSYNYYKGQIDFPIMTGSMSFPDPTDASYISDESSRIYGSGAANARLLNLEGSSVRIGLQGIGTAYQADSGGFHAFSDNVYTLGTSSARWTEVYAANGTINTSDANEKTDIVDISDAEKRVALHLKSAMKRFKFKDAVAKKGAKARYHFGAIAQEVKAAFHVEGLDAEEYGVFCADTLEDGSVRLGVRYDELFAFIISTL